MKPGLILVYMCVDMREKKREEKNRERERVHTCNAQAHNESKNILSEI